MRKFKNIIIVAGMTITAMACNTDKSSSSGKESEFYVRGNCGMCEERIEKAARDIEGVEKADWVVETKMLKVSYDSTKTSEAKIQQAVANVGHETKTVASPQSVHDELPECCKKGGNM